MKIKTLFYNDSLMFGGMHKQILYLAKYLNRQNNEPIICTQNSSKGGLKELNNFNLLSKFILLIVIGITYFFNYSIQMTIFIFLFGILFYWFIILMYYPKIISVILSQLFGTCCRHNFDN